MSPFLCTKTKEVVYKAKYQNVCNIYLNLSKLILFAALDKCSEILREKKIVLLHLVLGIQVMCGNNKRLLCTEWVEVV